MVKRIILLVTAAAAIIGGGLLVYHRQYAPVDMTGSVYAHIAAYQADFPHKTITYTVTIDDTLTLTEQDTAVTLTDAAQTETLMAQADYLPPLTDIHFGDTVPTAQQVLALQAAFPDTQIRYDNVELLGTVYPADTTRLSFSEVTPELTAQFTQELPVLPLLTDIDLDSSISLDDASALHAVLPELTYHYSVELFGQTLSTDMETVEYFKVKIGDKGLEQLRKLLPMMHSLTKLTLDWCETSDEAMAQLRDDFADDFQVVWRVFLGRFSVLTDSYKFWANGVTQAQADKLKYCTEIRYIDIGHSNAITNVEFLGYMPNLEVAIIADCLSLTSIEPLRNCTKLEYLEIFNDPITDLSPLEGMTSLQHLNFSDTQVRDLGPLYTLTGLQRVWGIANEQIPLSDIDDLRAALPDMHYQRWAKHPTDAGWRFIGGDEGTRHPRYALLCKQIGYDGWDISIYPKGHVTEPITYESTGITGPVRTRTPDV